MLSHVYMPSFTARGGGARWVCLGRQSGLAVPWSVWRVPWPHGRLLPVPRPPRRGKHPGRPRLHGKHLGIADHPGEEMASTRLASLLLVAMASSHFAPISKDHPVLLRVESEAFHLHLNHLR